MNLAVTLKFPVFESNELLKSEHVSSYEAMSPYKPFTFNVNFGYGKVKKHLKNEPSTLLFTTPSIPFLETLCLISSCAKSDTPLTSMNCMVTSGTMKLL